MKKRISLSLITLIFLAQNSHGMEQFPIEDQKEQLQQKFLQSIREASPKSASHTITEFIFTSGELRSLVEPQEAKKTLSQAKGAYKKFKNETKQKIKPDLWNLSHGLSDTEEPDPYDDLKKKLELKSQNQTVLNQLQTSIKQLELANSTEEKETEQLKKQIVELKAQLEKKEKHHEKNKKEIEEKKQNIQTGHKANTILTGIALVNKQALEFQFEKIKQKIKQKNLKISKAENETKKADLDRQATLKNNIEEMERKILELEKEKNSIELLIEKSELHLKGQSTFGMNWFPKMPKIFSATQSEEIQEQKIE